MNEYDSNRILDLTKKINYALTTNIGEANCYILNTCHIREKATDKVYHDIGRLKKKFRNKTKPIVIIAGCVAQAEGEILLKRENYIDAVVGPQSYHQINDVILKIEKKIKQINTTEFDVVEKFDTLNSCKNSDNRISTFLTIQEGCDKFCKFCVVPYTRGAEFSRSIKEIIAEANHLVENGAREINLLGQNVNAYNYKGKRISDLIKEISKIEKLKRIRYTTSHPRDFTEDLIETHKNCKKLMPLIHLPVQSGSNYILEKMNRKHTVEEYLEIIEKLVLVRPDIKFSSDFIIGYPGESNDDFDQTLKLVKKIKFINSFSFIYSPRPGTKGSKMQQLNKNTSKERLIELQSCLFKNQIDHNKSLENTEIDVLVENKIKDQNKYFGRNQYYNSVIFDADKNDIGKIIKVNVQNSNQNTLFGKNKNNMKAA